MLTNGTPVHPLSWTIARASDSVHPDARGQSQLQICASDLVHPDARGQSGCASDFLKLDARGQSGRASDFVHPDARGQSRMHSCASNLGVHPGFNESHPRIIHATSFTETETENYKKRDQNLTKRNTSN